jgi:flagellar hook assembly protein FlgD
MVRLYPNPFNLSTTIEYNLSGAKAGRITLDIYDIHGKLVRRLAQGPALGRTVSVTWDGTDAAGKAVCTGTYFCRLRVDGRLRATRKMLLIR